MEKTSLSILLISLLVGSVAADFFFDPWTSQGFGEQGGGRTLQQSGGFPGFDADLEVYGPPPSPPSPPPPPPSPEPTLENPFVVATFLVEPATDPSVPRCPLATVQTNGRRLSEFEEVVASGQTGLTAPGRQLQQSNFLQNYFDFLGQRACALLTAQAKRTWPTPRVTTCSFQCNCVPPTGDGYTAYQQQNGNVKVVATLVYVVTNPNEYQLAVDSAYTIGPLLMNPAITKPYFPDSTGGLAGPPTVQVYYFTHSPPPPKAPPPPLYKSPPPPKAPPPPIKGPPVNTKQPTVVSKFIVLPGTDAYVPKCPITGYSRRKVLEYDFEDPTPGFSRRRLQGTWLDNFLQYQGDLACKLVKAQAEKTWPHPSEFTCTGVGVCLPDGTISVVATYTYLPTNAEETLQAIDSAYSLEPLITDPDIYGLYFVEETGALAGPPEVQVFLYARYPPPPAKTPPAPPTPGYSPPPVHHTDPTVIGTFIVNPGTDPSVPRCPVAMSGRRRALLSLLGQSDSSSGSSPAADGTSDLVETGLTTSGGRQLLETWLDNYLRYLSSKSCDLMKSVAAKTWPYDLECTAVAACQPNGQVGVQATMIYPLSSPDQAQEALDSAHTLAPELSDPANYEAWFPEDTGALAYNPTFQVLYDGLNSPPPPRRRRGPAPPPPENAYPPGTVPPPPRRRRTPPGAPGYAAPPPPDESTPPPPPQRRQRSPPPGSYPPGMSPPPPPRGRRASPPPPHAAPAGTHAQTQATTSENAATAIHGPEEASSPGGAQPPAARTLAQEAAASGDAQPPAA